MRRIFERGVQDVTGGRRNHITRPNIICALQLTVSESIR
jgi:hypothetical protein